MNQSVLECQDCGQTFCRDIPIPEDRVIKCPKCSSLEINFKHTVAEEEW